jgi:hypothetical protein
MILPLWNQDCIVTLDGDDQQILGHARAPYVDINGRYRINVYSSRWGYERLFAPSEITLLPVTLPGGVLYDAHIAFNKRYTQEQADAFLAAEQEPVKTQVLPAAPKSPMQRARPLVKPMRFETESEALQSIAKTVQPVAAVRRRRVVRKPNG